MGKISKIIIITLLIAICLVNSTKVYAEKFNPSKFDPSGALKKEDYNDLWGKAGTILGLVKNIGAIVSVLGIAVLGLRYMFGSLEQKANYKETMFPFIIGIFITVGIVTIIQIVQSVAEKI